MNVKVEIQKEEALRRVLAIEVPEDEAAKEYEKVARTLAKKVRLPGFRKGKVPVSLVRKSFREELDREFLETVMPKAFGEALTETGLDPVTEPKFEEVSYGESRPLSFTADFECRPELELTGYRGVEAVKEVPEVTDDHVERLLEDFRKSRAALEEVERPAIDGDVLVLDYQALNEQDQPIPDRQVKGYTLELGSDQVVEAFEQAVKGAATGDVREAQVPYPEGYPDPVLAGSTARYRIKVKQVQEKRFPELTDELVAEHTDMKTVDELRERIRRDLGEQADRAGVDRLERVLLEKVVDANPFDPPKALVEGLLEDLVARQRAEAREGGADPEAVDADELRSRMRPAAEREVRRMLILDAIAERENLKVEPAELRDRIGLMARLRGETPRKVIDDFGGDRFLRRLTREMRDKKVLAFLVENAEISQKTVSVQPSETG